MHTVRMGVLAFAVACAEDDVGTVEYDSGDEQYELDVVPGEPDLWVDPVEYQLAAATTAGWLSQVVTAHESGGHPCATVDGDGVIAVTPGPSCPHPLLPELEGAARVEWIEALTLTFSASTEGLVSGGRRVLAVEFTWVQGVAYGTTNSVAFSTADYDERDWLAVVTVDTAGTADLADDGYEIDSVDNSPRDLPEDWEPANTPEIALWLTDVVVSPECRSNPISGYAGVTGWTYWPAYEVDPSTECDGLLYVPSTADRQEWSAPMDLLQGQ
jgi:hypothetical protein